MILLGVFAFIGIVSLILMALPKKSKTVEIELTTDGGIYKGKLKYKEVSGR